MHSVWSDGAETLESIVDACLARGYRCAGITDHSYGLAIARGMSMEQAARQHAEVDALNARYAGRFRLFKGIEANIRPDGTVDMPPEELRRFELAARALGHGCLFALDSDAHSHPELDFVDIALAHARLAGLPERAIVNYWTEKRFVAWAEGAWTRA
jgi:histidinol phosphatase-like PHP family hydrolase